MSRLGESSLQTPLVLTAVPPRGHNAAAGGLTLQPKILGQ
jgi:hypothetical protein